MKFKEKVYIFSPIHLVWESVKEEKEIKKWILEGSEINITEIEKGKKLGFLWKSEIYPVEYSFAIRLYPEPQSCIVELSYNGEDNLMPDLMLYWKKSLLQLKSFMERFAA